MVWFIAPSWWATRRFCFLQLVPAPLHPSPQCPFLVLVSRLSYLLPTPPQPLSSTADSGGSSGTLGMYSALARISRQTMLKKKADVNRKNGAGKTPLDMAFQASSVAVRKKLEDAGGKYNTVSKEDRPAPLVRRFCRMAHPRSPVHQLWQLLSRFGHRILQLGGDWHRSHSIPMNTPGQVNCSALQQTSRLLLGHRFKSDALWALSRKRHCYGLHPSVLQGPQPRPDSGSSEIGLPSRRAGGRGHPQVNVLVAAFYEPGAPWC